MLSTAPSDDTVGVDMIGVDERGMGPFVPSVNTATINYFFLSGCLIPSIPSDRLAAFYLKGDELIYRIEIRRTSFLAREFCTQQPKCPSAMWRYIERIRWEVGWNRSFEKP